MTTIESKREVVEKIFNEQKDLTKRIKRITNYPYTDRHVIHQKRLVKLFALYMIIAGLEAQKQIIISQPIYPSKGLPIVGESIKLNMK